MVVQLNTHVYAAGYLRSGSVYFCHLCAYVCVPICSSTEEYSCACCSLLHVWVTLLSFVCIYIYVYVSMIFAGYICPLCMCVCMYVYVYVCNSTVDVHTNESIHTYMHTYIFTHTYIHTHIHTYIHIHTDIQKYIHTYMGIYMNVCQSDTDGHVAVMLQPCCGLLVAVPYHELT